MRKMTAVQAICVLVGAAICFVMVMAKPIYYGYEIPWVAASVGAVIGGFIGRVISKNLRKLPRKNRNRQPYEPPYE